MTRHDSARLTPDFDRMYRENPDPWSVASSWYEQRKLHVMLSSLPRDRYASAWESGCGPGITTRALAARVERLLATDASGVAVDLARRLCADLAHVHLETRPLNRGIDGTPVELVVAAEFLYYVEDLGTATDQLWSAIEPSGHLVVMHWAHRPHDAYLSGTEVHQRIAQQASDRSAARLVAHAEPDFLLDIYEVR